MSLHPYSNEELNFFKFASIVLNEFPKALRHIFVDMWNKRIAPLPGYQLWDDSTTVRNMLLNSAGPKAKIHTSSSFLDWDCSALFQATLFARTFALPDSMGSMKTLNELYLKSRIPVPGPFHSPVASSSGDPNETIALAIDQLRLLRNTLCHSSTPRIAKVTFDQHVQHAQEAFAAVNWNTTSLQTIGNLDEADFPTAEVEELNEKITKERDEFYKFLEKKVNDRLDVLEEINEKMDQLLANSKTPDQSTMTADELKPETKYIHDSIDVLLLTTGKVEFAAAYKILSNPKSKDAEHQEQLYFGEIGRNKVALLKLLPTPNDVSRSYTMCAKTVEKLQPKAILSLGVCSGTNKNEHAIGDVLISSQVHFYEMSTPNRSGSRNPPSSTFECSLELTRLFNCGKFGWFGPFQEVLVPNVHIGQVISSPQNITREDCLEYMSPEAVGVDIQDGDLCTTCQNSGVPWVHCKSITNWVDESEDTNFHNFGAAVSTSFVEHVLKKFYIPEEIQNDVITVSCVTEYPVYEAGKAAKCWGLVTLKAPNYEPEKSKRPVLDIVAVIDKSGSMAGEKLSLVKQSLELLVQNLMENDRMCLITYDADVVVEFELCAMKSENKALANRKINKISVGSSTNLCAGLLQGLREIVKRRDKNDVAFVLLFTDGIANKGITETSMIVEAMKNPRKYRGVTSTMKKQLEDEVAIGMNASVYTFGFGHDHNAYMLKTISDATNGMYCYVENAKQILKSFGHCFGGLVSTVGNTIELDLELCDDGVTVDTIHTDQKIRTDDDLRNWHISLGDLQAEEQRDVLVTLNLPPVPSSNNSRCILKTSFKYYCIADSTHKDLQGEMVVTRLDNVHYSSNTANLAVDCQRNRVFATYAMKECLEMAEQGKLNLALKRMRLEIKRIKSSHSGKDHFCKLLVDELEETLLGLKDKASFEFSGGKRISNLLQEHTRQRNASMEENCSRSYRTSSQILYEEEFERRSFSK